jgi:hypothetical protein
MWLPNLNLAGVACPERVSWVVRGIHLSDSTLNDRLIITIDLTYKSYVLENAIQIWMRRRI